MCFVFKGCFGITFKKGLCYMRVLILGESDKDIGEVKGVVSDSHEIEICYSVSAAKITENCENLIPQAVLVSIGSGNRPMDLTRISGALAAYKYISKTVIIIICESNVVLRAQNAFENFKCYVLQKPVLSIDVEATLKKGERVIAVNEQAEKEAELREQAIKKAKESAKIALESSKNTELPIPPTPKAVKKNPQQSAADWAGLGGYNPNAQQPVYGRTIGYTPESEYGEHIIYGRTVDYTPESSEYIPDPKQRTVGYTGGELSVEQPIKKPGSNTKLILAIDDDPEQLAIIKKFLGKLYDVAVVTSWASANKYLMRCIPDLILLDYLMPEVDGTMVLKFLQNNISWRDIPVIFLTGVAEKDKVIKALVKEPRDYLLKPVKRGDIIDRVMEVFDELEESDA